ncbi:MAG: MFS transporter [Fusobacteriaceae bacterium]
MSQFKNQISQALTQEISYKPTINACYLGNFVQAIVINLPALLFVIFRETFHLNYQQLGFLVFINFTTQIAVDLIFSGIVDRYGFRRFVVAAHILVFIGFTLFGLVPMLPYNTYTLLLVATVIFSCGGGLLELLLSPIVNSIPTDEKASAMAILHSFYAWGQFTVIVLTALLLSLLGNSSWYLIVFMWSIPALINSYLFFVAPLAPPLEENLRQKSRDLVKIPFFLVAIATIAFSGAAEVSMAQWSSAFAEQVLHLPKITGDFGGIAMFAIFLGVGRVIYGKYSNKIDLTKIMILGAILAFFCYIILALSTIKILSLAAIAVGGLAVSLLWPGTLVLTSERFPMAGASMFAIMAAGGDLGAALGPWLIGSAAELSGFGLRGGILLGSVFPIGTLLCVLWMRRELAKKSQL